HQWLKTERFNSNRKASANKRFLERSIAQWNTGVEAQHGYSILDPQIRSPGKKIEKRIGFYIIRFLENNQIVLRVKLEVLVTVHRHCDAHIPPVNTFIEQALSHVGKRIFAVWRVRLCWFSRTRVCRSLSSPRES